MVVRPILANFLLWGQAVQPAAALPGGVAPKANFLANIY